MMNSSRKVSGTFRATAAVEGEGDVFVIGRPSREAGIVPAPIATAREIVAAAGVDALAIRARAEAEAAAAHASADAVRRSAFDEGFQTGHDSALGEAEAYLAPIRQAASEGGAIRDSIAASHEALLARALVVALRRIVGDHYLAAPDSTLAICREALRSAAGQDVIAIRVNPAVANAIHAALVDMADYVRPDEGVAIGGCIVDLRYGTIDATLDARLNLLTAALSPDEQVAA